MCVEIGVVLIVIVHYVIADCFARHKFRMHDANGSRFMFIIDAFSVVNCVLFARDLVHVSIFEARFRIMIQFEFYIKY